MSEEYEKVFLLGYHHYEPYGGISTACTLDEKNPHIIILDQNNVFKKGDEFFVFCEIHEGYIKIEKAEEKETESKFTGGFVGDGIVRECGAVGHGCDDCYIKCDLNPRTQEEDDERFIMEDWDHNPYDER